MPFLLYLVASIKKNQNLTQRNLWNMFIDELFIPATVRNIVKYEKNGEKVIFVR